MHNSTVNQNPLFNSIFDFNEICNLERQSSISHDYLYNTLNEKIEENSEILFNQKHEQNEENILFENKILTRENIIENLPNHFLEGIEEFSNNSSQEQYQIDQRILHELGEIERADSNNETIVKINLPKSLSLEEENRCFENRNTNQTSRSNANLKEESEQHMKEIELQVKEKKSVLNYFENSDTDLYEKCNEIAKYRSDNLNNPNLKRKQKRVRIQGKFVKSDKILRILNLNKADFVSNAQLQKIILENKDYQINAQINKNLRISHIQLLLLKLYPNYNFPTPSSNSCIDLSTNLIKNEEKKTILTQITINRDKKDFIQVKHQKYEFQYKYKIPNSMDHLFQVERDGNKIDSPFYNHIFHHKTCFKK